MRLKFLLGFVLTLLVIFTNITAQAAVTFALRGDSLTPRYAKGGKARTHWLAPATAGSPPVVASLGHASVFGGQAIDFRFLGDTRTEKYRLGESWVNGTNVFSILIRFVPDWTGNPPHVIRLLRIGPALSAADAAGGVFLEIEDNGKLFGYGRYNIDAGGNIFNFTTASALSFTSGTATEIMLVSNGTNFYISQDGVEIHTAALTDSSKHFDNVTGSVMDICPYPCDMYVNELVIWDTAEAHVYSARSGFFTVDDFDGTSNTNPGTGNVKTGTSYTIAGVAQTGTYDGSDRWTDPGVANVRSGTAYKANSTSNNRTGTAAIPSASDVLVGVAVDAATGTYVGVTAGEVKTGVSFGVGLTGTYDGSDRWTCPLDSQLSSGVQLKCNSTSLNLTGTRQTVTNTMSNATMSGQRTSATLTAQ